MSGHGQTFVDFHNAAETYQKGMAVAPDNPRFAVGFAGIREREGRYEEAISTYEKILRPSAK